MNILDDLKAIVEKIEGAAVAVATPVVHVIEGGSPEAVIIRDVISRLATVADTLINTTVGPAAGSVIENAVGTVVGDIVTDVNEANVPPGVPTTGGTPVSAMPAPTFLHGA
jgi:hypothetical protein